MTAAPGPWRAAGLLARLRLRRITNALRSAARYRVGAPDRKAASPVSPGRGVFIAVVLCAMFASFSVLSWQSVTNIEEGPAAAATAPVGAAHPARPPERHAAPNLRAAPAPGRLLSAPVISGVTVAATLVLLTSLFGAVARRDLARPDWDLEWLVTLPLPLATLLGALVVERAVALSFGFVFLSAFLTALAFKCGWGFAAPVVAIALVVPLLFLTAIVQIVADTGLRLVLAPARLRNVQAVASLTVTAPLIAFMSLASPANLFVLDWLPFDHARTGWLPAGLLVDAVASDTPWRAAGFLAVLLAEVAVAVAAGAALTGYLMRNGVVAAGARDGTVRRPRPRKVAPQPSRWPPLLSPVQRRDLLLLGRDRTLLVQVLVLPILTVGLQVAIRGNDAVLHGFQPALGLAALAFFLAAFTLMQPSFRTMASEGPALWVLYSLPHTLERIVLHKAALWGALACVYPVAIFAAVIAGGHPLPLEFALSIPVVFVGVPVFAVIGASLGVFAFDPLALDEHRRIRLTYLYLYMMLGSFYSYAIFAPGLWQRAALMILTALVATALWQKARDHFEYLLDPVSAPPSRVSVADGLIAALGFFVVQGTVGLFITEGLHARVDGSTLWLAFTAAGGLVFGVVRFVYWRSHTEGVPVLLPAGEGVRARLMSPLGWGLAGGAAAAACGIAYLQTASALGLMPQASANPMLADPDLPYWLAALAVLAAPVFEEFIFRGLIFSGLRRSLGVPAAALASAAIFGLVHPPAAAFPVAVMGLLAALVYARTGALAAAMLVHAVYNAAVLAFQWETVFGAGLHG